MRIKDNAEFYEYLHHLEDTDPEWFVTVGDEVDLNHFVSPNKLVDRKRVSSLRKNLKRLRQILINDENPIYNYDEDRLGIRLLVTLYHNYGLNTNEISALLKIKPNTLRRNYPELKLAESIKDASEYQVVLRNRSGHRLGSQEGD